MTWSGAEKAKKQADKEFFWKLVQQLRLFCAELPPDDVVENEIDDSRMDTSISFVAGIDGNHLAKGLSSFRLRLFVNTSPTNWFSCVSLL